MSLRNEKVLEAFQFSTLGELRDWLNLFTETDLDGVSLEGQLGHATLYWKEETLSDGSTANNAEIV